MSIDLTRGRAKSSKNGIGGVSKLYLFNFLEDAFTVVAGSGVASAMNVALTEAFVYDLTGDGQVLAEDMVGDRSAGTTTNTQTVTCLLQKIDVATSAEMKLIANDYPIAVVLSKDGNYHLVGATEGIDFTINSSTGSTQAEFNGYNLVGTSTEKELGAILDSSTVTAFLAVVTAN
jgi:hypothetical protein